MKPFYLYMLRCADASLYVGHTDDLDARLEAHASGALGGYTSTRRPLQLVYAREFPTRLEALELELRIKGWTRAKKEALIVGDWARLKRLSRGPDLQARHSSLRRSH